MFLNLLLFAYIYIAVACFVTYQAIFYDHSRCVNTVDSNTYQCGFVIHSVVKYSDY